MSRFVLVQVDFMREGRKNRGFLEKVETQNLQDFVHTAVEIEFFLDDGHQDVDADRYPNLSLDRVFGGPIESLNAQVLFDPFEEKFHLPATLVKLGDCQSVQHEVVGQEHKTFAGVGIHVLDPPQ